MDRKYIQENGWDFSKLVTTPNYISKKLREQKELKHKSETKQIKQQNKIKISGHAKDKDKILKEARGRKHRREKPQKNKDKNYSKLLSEKLWNRIFSLCWKGKKYQSRILHPEKMSF